MDKKEYIGISNLSGLTPRCPILDICQRRALTIYYFSYLNEGNDTVLNWEDFLYKNGEINDVYNHSKIEIQGESPTIIKGNRGWLFSNMCPEVCLFKGEHTPIGFENVACSSGDCDKERKINKNRISEEKHFSECSEFSKYLSNKNVTKVISLSKKIRKNIPQKTRAQLQKEINSECPFCKNGEVGHFQIHHIDENPANNDWDNLILLCPICHSKITKGEISTFDVQTMKQNL